jgi:hypothetical protein
MKWGGKHDLTFEEYHSVPARWSAEGLEQQRIALGGTFDLGYRGHPRAHQSMWYNLADGVRAGDSACIELAVRFIEDRFISSYSGFARTKIARALKHAPLSREQRARLSLHFLQLLEKGDRTEEFSEYLRVWPRVISTVDRKLALELAMKLKSASPDFRARLTAALTSNNALEADRES